MSALSLRVRKARTAALLSQAELARRIGVKRSAVTQWEHPAGTMPSVDHLIQIALLTDTHFEWLATGRGNWRSDDSEAIPAVIVGDYAHDEQESRLLDRFRELSPSLRKVALKLLDALAR